MSNWRRTPLSILLIVLMQGKGLPAAIASDDGTAGRSEAAPLRQEFRFEDYVYLGRLPDIEEAVRTGLLGAFPAGSPVEPLIHLIEHRDPRRGRYCLERTEDTVWCQYWHPLPMEPRISVMYWVRIYHVGEPKRIKDIGVKVVAG